MRETLKKVWYTFFSLPPTYVAGRTAMAFMSQSQIEWFRREFFCQTRTFSKPVHVLGRLVRAVESYDFGRKSAAEQAKETYDFWASESGYRWHVERHSQIPEELRKNQDVCLEFLAGQPFSRVIEIGGGNGLFLRRLQEVDAKPRYVGVDINRDIIERARGMYPGIQFVVGDIFEYLKAEESLQDTIVASRWTSVFFTAAQMQELLAIIKAKRGMVYFAENYYHRLDQGIASKYSGARKQSHDYAGLIREAGMTVVKEQHYQPIDEGGLIRVLAR